MKSETRQYLVMLLESMKCEAEDISIEYSSPVGDRSPEALYNVLASVSSKQAAFCEVLIHMLKEG